MPFVRRDESGRIAALLREREPGASEYLPPESSEVRDFVRSEPSDLDALFGELVRSDLEMIRVYEDLLNALIAKKIVLLTDLPPEAQAKLLRRRRLRGALGDIGGLIAGEDDEREELP